MARALLTALGRGAEALGCGPARLASEFQSREGRGDPAAQASLAAAAEMEAARIAGGPRPSLWFTYHNYYKAPDLLGPRLTRGWGSPYILAEATRAKKRLGGPWDRFAKAAEAATDAADLVFYLTERDREALEAARPETQRLAALPPFLNRDLAGAPPPRRESACAGSPLQLLAVGMMRPGAKRASYGALAAALRGVQSDWRLDIVGDGPARPDVEALFSPFGARVRLAGALDAAALAARYAAADLFVWPGVDEAFGMVYLEAQAAGAPVIAEDRPGVRDVARDGAIRPPADDPAAFAAAIDALANDPARRSALGAAGFAQVAAEHDLGAAARRIEAALEELGVGRGAGAAGP